MATPRDNSYSVASGESVYAGLGPTEFNARVAIWGQSNAVGRAARSEISAPPLSSDPGLAAFDAGTFDRVWIWNGSAFIKLQPSVFRGVTNAPGQFGPEFGLAVRWMRETAAGNLYLEKNCEGGISITTFEPGVGGQYNWGMTEFGQATTWLASNGVAIDRKAMLWTQGEQDAAQSQSWYETRLSALLSDLRFEGVIDADSLAVLSQMHPSSGAYGAGVAAAKTALAAASPDICKTLQMPFYMADSVHTNARGQVQHAYDAYRLIFGGEQINV